MTGIVPAMAAAAATMAAAAGVRAWQQSDRRADRWSRRLRDASASIVHRTAWGRQLSAQLGRSGIALTVEQALASCVATAVGLSLGVVWFTHSSWLGVLAGVAVLVGARSYVSASDQRYLGRFAAQLPAVAQQLGSAVGAGLSLRQAIQRAAADTPEPAGAELGRITQDLTFGTPIDEALERATERLPDPGFRMMVVAIVIQRTIGGNLGQALTELSARLEERAALVKESRSATAQARMSAWLVAGLPLAGGVFVEIAAPGTLSRTLGQGIGQALVLVAVALQGIGVVLIRKLIASGVEAR